MISVSKKKRISPKIISRNYRIKINEIKQKHIPIAENNKAIEQDAKKSKMQKKKALG